MIKYFQHIGGGGLAELNNTVHSVYTSPAVYTPLYNYLALAWPQSLKNLLKKNVIKNHLKIENFVLLVNKVQNAYCVVKWFIFQVSCHVFQ
jgi:hypothetical protein